MKQLPTKEELRGWRVLAPTERVRDGDVLEQSGELQWAARSIGRFANDTSWKAWYRNETGWVSTADRLPTKEDGRDVFMKYKDATVYAVFSVTGGGWDGVSHWMRIPPTPGPEPVMIGEHEVEFLPDGGVQVGCTKVDGATLDEIQKRRVRK